MNFCIELKKKLKGSGLDKTKNLTVENRPGIGMQMCMENLKKKDLSHPLKSLLFKSATAERKNMYFLKNEDILAITIS